VLAVARKPTASQEKLQLMTPSEAPKAQQASKCSELLDLMRANCWFPAQREPGKFAIDLHDTIPNKSHARGPVVGALRISHNDVHRAKCDKTAHVALGCYPGGCAATSHVQCECNARGS
jgi:hypothetical protein